MTTRTIIASEMEMNFDKRSRSTPSPITMTKSIVEMNNHGVTLMRDGNSYGAMMCLSRCLNVMKMSAPECDNRMEYRFVRSSAHLGRKDIKESTSTMPSYVFVDAIEIIDSNRGKNSVPRACFASNEAKNRKCKILSIVLFNIALSHHLWAFEVGQIIQNEVQDGTRRKKECHEVLRVLSKALRLYELCHSSLEFTTSGVFCSDLSIAVVVTNNIGEVHKKIDLYQRRNEKQCDSPSECGKTAIACSEQLVQIFMFFAVNGGAENLGDFGDVLLNAMATLNGAEAVAPAA